MDNICNNSTESSNHSSNYAKSLRLQVATDLKNKLTEYNDPKRGLKIMATAMGIHEKTLKRLLNSQNKPGYQTLLKIYRFIYRSNNDSKLIEQVPKIISEVLLKAPIPLEQGICYSIDVEKEIFKDIVFREIYLHAGTGGVTSEYIAFQFGQYGQQVLTKMLEEDVLSAVDINTFKLGSNQASMGPETIKKLGQHLVNSYSKPENSDIPGSHFLGLYLESLTEEAYNQWIKIDEMAFKEKVAIAKKSQNRGHCKAFTFIATDTLSNLKKIVKH